jgi:ABC-type transport system involved in cytochrome c biogenesis permease subunit
MSTNAPHKPGEFGEPPPRAGTERGPAYYALKGLKALASLQLTVGLFALGILLIFFGTLAQLDHGIWTVVDKYFWSTYVWIPFELIHKFLGVFWKESFPPNTAPWTGSFPFPAGLTIGLVMVINLLAAHALRFKLTWKRSGIFLIHGGMLMLFAGEFMTREFAVEQQMTIPEGQSVNFAEDSRNTELVFVDHSGAEDRVVVIAQKRLARAKPGERIKHDDLPVDVEVVKFMKHADFKEPSVANPNPATGGLGRDREMVAVPAQEQAGVDQSQRVDLTSAYVKLFKKGTNDEVGTYLVSLLISLQGLSDTIKVDGKPYEITLRRARLYKPYSIHLDKFRFDRYVGTNKPRNYSSDVRVFEPGNTEPVRTAHIAMNEPMRFGGETFYQQSFDKSETTTILQVVKNPGSWNLGFVHLTIDYLACLVVGLGLVLHFGIYLLQFLRRQPQLRAAPTAAAAIPVAPPVEGWTASRVFPWAMLAFAAVGLMMMFARMTPREYREPYDLNTFARLPVIEGGRVKPLETVARVYLRTISHRETFVDEKGDTQPAIKWYLDVISADPSDESAAAWQHKVFRIDNDQVANDLKLEHPREGRRYSLNEIRPQISRLMRVGAEARMKIKAKKKVDLTETKMIELEERITITLSLTRFRGLNLREEDTLRLLPPESDGKWQSLGEFRDTARHEADRAGVAAAGKILLADLDRFKKLTPGEERELVRKFARIELDRVPPAERAELVKEVVDELLQPPMMMPPQRRGAWIDAVCVVLPPADAERIKADVEKDYRARMASSPAAVAWDRMVTAAKDKKPEEFNKAVADYRDNHLSGVPLADRARTKTEITYDRFAPFYQCTGFYVFALVLALVGFFLYVAEVPQWAVALRRSAFLVLLLTLVVHTVALVSRMYIMERWGVFVTNLYSSAVFIGCGCVALCLILERIFPIGVGNVVASVLGLATTIVAHNLGTNDTLEMMEAVLDTNFWLATHVTTVTLGYTATFVAGFLGAVYVFMMLGTVIRDSFQKIGEPTVGELLAFGAAAVGVVGVPSAFLAFMTLALDKFEIVNSFLLWTAFGVVVAAGGIYALGLMLLRVGMEGVDAQGKPLSGHVPGLAKPVAAFALTPESSKIIGQMVYGVVCFATMLSFIGTVLGGIWADQSWGRFWGWDPKENGAVLIVLWNALILHARWCGWVKDRGVAVLAIFGNVVTAWSWFGTNQLGIGLHAYGFDSRLADGCFNFWISQLFILTLGLIPSRFWPGARRPTAVLVAAAAAPTPVTDAAAAPPPAAPTASQNGSTNGAPHASPNGNGHPNVRPGAKPPGQPPPRRDKRKPGKRR